MASRVARIASLPGLLLLGTAAAWAGRGDLDPNYGEGGRASTIPGVMRALPGDRLVIADAATEEGSRIRMVDAAGKNVPDFGDGGVALIPSPASAGTFQPEAAALAPNGDMIFVRPLVGSVNVDLGAELLDEPLCREYVDQLILDPDDEHFIAQLSVSRADGSLVCTGIAP